MRKCNCNSTQFFIKKEVPVKFLLDGNLNIVKSKVEIPDSIEGIIVCEKCGQEYTKETFFSLKNT